MKLNLYIKIALACACLLTSAASYGQGPAISLKFQDVPLKTVLGSIEKQTGKLFFYEDNLINPKEKVTIQIHQAPLDAVIKTLFGNRITCSLVDNHIVLKKNMVAAGNTPANTPVPVAPEVRSAQTPRGTVSEQDLRTVRGTVTYRNNPLAGVAITLKNNPKVGTLTNANGEFSITVPVGSVLVASYVGLTNREATVGAQSHLQPILFVFEDATEQIDQVVVIGTIQRKAESFTGVTKTVTGDELRRIGSNNLVESLKTLDPSFMVQDNVLSGSDPNVMPKVEIRGQTSIDVVDVEDRFRTDPNQPLFILNGFETTLQKIIDLDFNRVASVTILKDAASTAMYGSRASNGVVVVETIKGSPGRYKIFYTGDFSVQWPDLSSYNLMNASEKLDFEVRSQRYKHLKANGEHILQTQNDVIRQRELDELYYRHLAEVERGVNTDWLRIPLQTSLINRQSVRVSGGSQEMAVDANIFFRNAPGVMKGSKRDAWGGGIGLAYFKGKFSIKNDLEVTGYTGVDSYYGSLADFEKVNPYYRKTDEFGVYQKYLEDNITDNQSLQPYLISNPLYNASLNNKSEMSNLRVDNNFQAIWNLYKGMQLHGSLLLSTAKTESVRFIAPEHTQFDKVTDDKKGSYYNQARDDFNYQARLMYVWNNTIDRHSYTLNAQGEIAHEDYQSLAMRAEGFPYGTNGNPIFAASYAKDERPEYSSSKFRRMNLLLTGNYSFDNRYLLDASYRLDGSTAFGSQKKYSPFWAIGLGWNIHNEKFFGEGGVVNWLKLTANIGQTGNQNTKGSLSTSVYTYVPGSNSFGVSTALSELGNPMLAWQNTRQTSLNLDVRMLENRLSFSLNAYEKFTDPLVVAVDQVPSVGQATYTSSLGTLTIKGLEFNVAYYLIRDMQRRILWNVRAFGTVLDGRYDDFSDKLKSLNEAAQKNNKYVRYTDGYSNTAIWAVRSLGIDPACGEEMFQTKNGAMTYRYNPEDVIVVGNTNPDLTGVIGSSLTIRNLSFGFSLRYSFGGQVLNYDLYENVENIDGEEINYNQDKRALYQRWEKAGDIAQFKRISTTTETPISSRFVQTENYLSGEALNIGWRFENTRWLRTLGMEQLNLNASINNFFRWSTVKMERGTNYALARTATLSINAIF